MPSRPASRVLVSLVAAAAGGVLAARPTGVGFLDVLWSAAFVGALAYVSFTAPRLHLLGAAGVASVLAGTSTSLTAAVLATAFVAFHATRRRPSPQLSGITGALLGLSLLTGNGPDERWVQALTTTGLTVFLLVVGLGGMSRRRRRRILRWSTAVVGVLVLCGAAGALAALRARTHVDAGIDAFRTAQQAATGADLAAAVDAFGDAEGSFDDASTLLSGLGRFGRIVPGLAQQLEAAGTAVDAAEQAAEAARVAGAQVDLDTVGLRDGAVDLAAVRAAEAPVAGLVETLVRTVERLARVDRSFLVAPVSDALDDALEEARAAGTSVDRLHRSVRIAPDLLGERAPTRFLVLFTSPVEARGRLGFPAAYAILGADGGRLGFERGGGIADLDPEGRLFDPLALQIPPRAQSYVPYGVALSWRQVTIPPHAPATADLAVQMAAQAGFGRLDGVVYAGPEALATIVGLVGDVPLQSVGITLTEANTADFLNRQQYLEFPELGQQADRKDLLEEVAQLVGARLGRLSLPRAQDLLDRFGPLVDTGQLVVSVPERIDPDAAGLLADVGLDGGFPGPGDDDADVVMVTHRNAVINKIDLFLERAITYDVVVDEDGMASGDLAIDLTNAVPDGDLPLYLIGSGLDVPPPVGTNISTVLVYSRYTFDEVTLDGETVVPPVVRDGSFLVYQLHVELGRGQTRTIHATFSEEAVGPSPYEVVLEPGGLVQPDQVAVRLRDERAGEAVDESLSLEERACVSLRRGEQRCT